MHSPMHCPWVQHLAHMHAASLGQLGQLHRMPEISHAAAYTPAYSFDSFFLPWLIMAVVAWVGCLHHPVPKRQLSVFHCMFHMSHTSALSAPLACMFSVACCEAGCSPLHQCCVTCDRWSLFLPFEAALELLDNTCPDAGLETCDVCARGTLGAGETACALAGPANSRPSQSD